MTNTIRVMLMALVALTFTACETTKGFGRDVERAGDKVEDATD